MTKNKLGQALIFWNLRWSFDPADPFHDRTIDPMPLYNGFLTELENRGLSHSNVNWLRRQVELPLSFSVGKELLHTVMFDEDR